VVKQALLERVLQQLSGNGPCEPVALPKQTSSGNQSREAAGGAEPRPMHSTNSIGPPTGFLQP
jgi:hypothetical protein